MDAVPERFTGAPARARSPCAAPPDELVLTDALLVVPGEVVPGTVVLRGGLIAEVAPGETSRLPGAVSLGGDHLIPGAVDIHSDNLERQAMPRAGARWPSRSALIAHDAQTAAAGVTTVLDALCVGDIGFEAARERTFQDGAADLLALHGSGLLRADHFLHLRCELPAPGMLRLLEPAADHPLLRMVSLMDHSPGVGQFTDLARYRKMQARDGRAASEIEAMVAHLTEQRLAWSPRNRAALLAMFAGRADLPLASHDDWDAEVIAANARDGITVSEFPVNEAAARAARAHGLAVAMGAPNLVRGGSHSGNVAVSHLAALGLVDLLASDYVPSGMVEGAWRAARDGLAPLHRAVAWIADAPARILGFHDRGRIEPGLRADLARVATHDGLPVVRAVWRAGERVA